MLLCSFVCLCRLTVISCFSDISGWISAVDGLCLPSFPSTNKKVAIVIDSLSHLIFSLSEDHVCQVLNRLCRQTGSMLFSNSALQLCSAVISGRLIIIILRVMKMF